MSVSDITRDPSLVSLSARDAALFDGVRSLKWPARRRAAGGVAGDHVARTLGVSAEFTQYRLYRPGDDTSRIDWKLLARSNRAYIRLSNDRTLLPTTIVADASGSLAYPSATLEKWHFARHVAIGMSAASLRGGDPAGLAIATAGGARRLAPRTRRGTVRDIARVLSDVLPAGSPALAPLLLGVSSARIAIISDFLGDADAVLKVGGQLAAAGREVYAIHIVHASELDPPKRPALFADPEDDGFRRPMDESSRSQYLDQFAEWRSELARRWRMTGAYYYMLSTGEPAARAVRRVVTGRSVEDERSKPR